MDDDADAFAALKQALREPFELLWEPNPSRALGLLDQRFVEVVIAEQHLTGITGSEFLARAYQRQPDAVRIVLTSAPTLDAALYAINRARVARYLRKPCSAEELARNITDALLERQARTHSHVLQPSAAEIRPTRTLPGLSEPERDALSVREREVLALLVSGLRLTQIAQRLAISAHTVRNHLKTLYRKLDLHSQGALIEHARGRDVGLRKRTG